LGGFRRCPCWATFPSIRNPALRFADMAHRYGWWTPLNLYARTVDWETNWVGLQNVHVGQPSFQNPQNTNGSGFVETPSLTRFTDQGTGDLICCGVLERFAWLSTSTSELYDMGGTSGLYDMEDTRARRLSNPASRCRDVANVRGTYFLPCFVSTLKTVLVPCLILARWLRGRGHSLLPLSIPALIAPIQGPRPTSRPRAYISISSFFVFVGALKLQN